MDVIERLKTTYQQGITKPKSYRRAQLANLFRFLEECQKDIESALYHDLKKSEMEAFITEIYLVRKELAYARKKLSSWMKPRRVRTNLIAQPGKSVIYSEPYGVVLIIAPWNYPFLLSLAPLIGAIAAGNCVLLKPSETASATSQLLAEKLPKYLDSASIQVIQGGEEETNKILDESFDYIFYTGGGRVGRIVMEKAAKHLTPVSLELGGKSPCIVDKNTDISVVAHRIVWGKFLNAGQTCIAPDYVLVHKEIEKQLAIEMKNCIQQFFGENPQLSPSYSRIINIHHHRRIMGLLPKDRELFVGGVADEADLYIAPTIVRNIPMNHPIMNEEIFGPILPLFSVSSIDEAVSMIHKRAKPLALYLFSHDKSVQRQVIEETSSGCMGINQIHRQITVYNLPFGGVGESGMGNYHGKASFDTFSHSKSVLKMSTRFDFSIFYPPYKQYIKKILRWL